MPQNGTIKDIGRRGLIHQDKPLIMRAASWVEPLGSVVFFDDFLGDTLNTDAWVATETGTGTPWAVSATAGDPVAAHGGWVASATQNIDAAAEELASMAATTVGNFRPDRAGNGMLVFQARLTIPTAVTARIVNAGLTDDESEGAALAATFSTATWTTTATDAALWVYDSTATTPLFRGIAVKADVDATAVVGVVPVADTAHTLRIEIDSAGNVWYFQNATGGNITREHVVGVQGAAVTATVPLIPYVALGSTTTTAANLELDYVFTACAR